MWRVLTRPSRTPLVRAANISHASLRAYIDDLAPSARDMCFARDMSSGLDMCFARDMPRGTPCPLNAARKNPSRSHPSRSRSEHLARELASVYRIERSEIYRRFGVSGARYVLRTRYACGRKIVLFSFFLRLTLIIIYSIIFAGKIHSSDV